MWNRRATFGCALVVILTLARASEQVAPPQQQHDPDLLRNSGPETLEIITARGFSGELYQTRSLDGYTITIYHIINPLADQTRLNSIPVLMFHGIGGDSAQMISHSEQSRPRRPVPGQVTFVEDGGDDSLAFMLSNNNYDVYVVDARGTNLNNHKSSADIGWLESQRFWNFSLDEQLNYDLPLVIDFVLTQTGSNKLHYIGFSQSTFFMFALLSSRPEFHSKLASFTALSPVAYVSHARGSAIYLLLPVMAIPDWVNANYVPQPISDSLVSVLRQTCTNQLFADTLCRGLLRSLSGVGVARESTTFFANTFKSTSIKALRHFARLYQRNRFGSYDYGPEGNLRQYGQTKAPDYELGRIKLPTIILVRGLSDFLSTPEDQARLLAELGVRPYLDIVLPKYSHLDFLLSATIMRDIHLPVARSLLDISSKLSGPPWRDARRRVYRPLLALKSTGRRHLRTHQVFGTNLVNGLKEAHESVANKWPGSPFNLGVEQSLNLLQNVGRLSDTLTQSVSSLTGKVIGNGL